MDLDETFESLIVALGLGRVRLGGLAAFLLLQLDNFYLQEEQLSVASVPKLLARGHCRNSIVVVVVDTDVVLGHQKKYDHCAGVDVDVGACSTGTMNRPSIVLKHWK